MYVCINNKKKNIYIYINHIQGISMLCSPLLQSLRPVFVRRDAHRRPPSRARRAAIDLGVPGHGAAGARGSQESWETQVNLG